MSTTRTLLLAPPSISAHPEALDAIFEAHDRNATDIQMLDRLALGLVSLPASTYDLVLLLTDVDAGRTDGGSRQPLLDRDTMARVAQALKPGGRFRSQDGSFAATPGAGQTEAILAGLISDGNGVVKPLDTANQTVKLNFGKKSNAAAVPLNAVEAANKNAEADKNAAAPAGVGFVDGTQNEGLGDDDDDDDDIVFPTKAELMQGDMIDPDTLLTDADRQKPIIIPEACKPNGKRRRACKDCSCGLKQRIEAEDAAARSKADASLQTLKLGADDLAEVDFTVQGKVGSCGNCALGDAFRCDGCPYIGLPAFKPGEEVRLLNNDFQL